MKCAAFPLILSAVAVLSLLTPHADARATWFVDDDAPNDPGPGDPAISDPLEDGSPEHPFDAIQEAVQVSVNGDLVLVLDGTYRGPGNVNINFGGRLITVRSENGPDVCAVDCEGSANRAFDLRSGETPDAVIDGFTLKNAGFLAALRISQTAAATIRNCIIRDNAGLNACGGAMISSSTSATTVFSRCRFTGNSGGGATASPGGAVLVYGYERVDFVDCVFSGNRARYGAAVATKANGQVRLINCDFVRNYASVAGGGVLLGTTYLESQLVNCRFVGNSGGGLGGGIAICNLDPAIYYTYLYNCTFAGNGAVLGRSIGTEAIDNGASLFYAHNCIFHDGTEGTPGGIYIPPNEGSIEPRYCCLSNGPGGDGNLVDIDPLFVQAPDPGPDELWGTLDDDLGDLHLQAGSPCIDAADGSSLPADEHDLDGDGDTTEPIPWDLERSPRIVEDRSTIDQGIGFPCADMGCLEFHPHYVAQPGLARAWGSNQWGQCTLPSPCDGFLAACGGDRHSLGLMQDSTIVAWGDGSLGQCSIPAPNADFVGVAAGGFHSLGVRRDGTLIAWGDDAAGQCGVPAPDSAFVAAAGGASHSLGLKSNGTVVAWGDDSFNQCDVPEPNAGFLEIAAGLNHSLGLKSDSTLVAWGDNAFGQCDVPEPNGGFVALAGGGGHSLGLRSDGTIAAWGDNAFGQCDVPAPNADFAAVAAGRDHSLGLKLDGTLVAWGRNDANQCEIPLPNTGFFAVAAGADHSLAVGEDLTSSIDDHPGIEATSTWLGVRAVTPNPFRDRTMIWMDVPQARGGTLGVYDLSGRLVRTVWRGNLELGRRAVVWDGRDDRGQALPSGVYLVHLRAASGQTRSVRMILAR